MKHPIFAIYLLIVTLTITVLSSCDRANMYDLAKNGPDLVFAITDDGATYNTVIISDGRDYTREYLNEGPYFSPTNLFVNDRGDLMVTVSGASVYITSNGYSNWEGPFPDPGTGSYAGIAGIGNDFYLLMDAGGSFYIYRFDKNTNSWVDQQDIYSALTGAAELASKSNGIFALVTELASTDYYYYIYNLNDMQVNQIAAYNNGPSGLTLPFVYLSYNDGLTYLGGASYFVRSSGSSFNTIANGLSGITGYAVTETGRYAALSSSDVLCFDGSVFVTIFSFSAASGDQVLPLSGSKIVVSSSGSPGSADNGLLVFDLEDKSLNTHVTSKNVAGIDVM